MEKPRILLVEDEYIIRLTLAEALSDAGYLVEEAQSTDEAMTATLALEKAGQRIALLITDIQLAGPTDGLGLVRALRQRQPELPAIYVTGRPDAMGKTHMSARDVFVAKPYLPSQITSICRGLIGTVADATPAHAAAVGALDPTMPAAWPALSDFPGSQRTQ